MILQTVGRPQTYLAKPGGGGGGGGHKVILQTLEGGRRFILQTLGRPQIYLANIVGRKSFSHKSGWANGLSCDKSDAIGG